MLILTDRAKGGRAIYDNLTRGRRCDVVPLHQAQAQPLKHPIIVCDVDIGNMTSVRLLRAALKLHRGDADIPVLFLTRDSSRLTAALAISLDATELVYCNDRPTEIHAAAERLIYAYQSRNKGATPPASVTEASASDAKSALASCFDAVKRGDPVSIAELDRGASVVLGAIKQAKIRSWLDVVWQFDDATYQHCLLVAGLCAAFSLKSGLTSKSSASAVTGRASPRCWQGAHTPRHPQQAWRPIEARDGRHADPSGAGSRHACGPAWHQPGHSGCDTPSP